jgi:hypothetical protein
MSATYVDPVFVMTHPQDRTIRDYRSVVNAAGTAVIFERWGNAQGARAMVVAGTCMTTGPTSGGNTGDRSEVEHESRKMVPERVSPRSKRQQNTGCCILPAKKRGIPGLAVWNCQSECVVDRC